MNEQQTNWLQTQAVALEKQRKLLSGKQSTYKWLMILASVLKVVCYLASIVAMVLIIFLPPVGFVIALVTVAVVMMIQKLEAKKSPQQRFLDTLKKEIVPHVFKRVNPNLSYAHTGFNALAIEKSGLLNQHFFSKTVDMIGEDYVKGNVQGRVLENGSSDEVAVEFVELKFFKNEVNFGKAGLGCLANLVLIPAQIIHNIFEGNRFAVYDLVDVRMVDANEFYSGLFLSAFLPPSLARPLQDGELLMVPKSQASLTDNIKDKLQKTKVPKHLQEVQVADQTIQHNYTVYASDVKMVHQLLTTDLVTFISHHASKENVLPSVSFRENSLFVLIPWSKDYFNADINQPINDASYFAGFFQQVASFERMVKALT